MENRVKKVMEEIKREKYSWAESATAVFAFLNIVVVSITSLISLGFLIGTSVEALTIIDDKTVTALGIAIALITGVLVAFAFAILLYIGIYQKKPGFVLAYFIFGIIVDITVVSAVLAVNYAPTEDVRIWLLGIVHDYYEPISHEIIWICVVYTLVLIMICRTWWLMTSRRSEDREQLANYYYADWEKE